MTKKPPFINDKFLFFDEQEKDFIAEILKTKQLSGTSEIVAQYEHKLCSHFGSRFAVAVNSGTAALNAALYAVGATEGAEVLIPATAPIPSGLPLLTVGAIPVFVDVQTHSLGFDPHDLSRKITARTKAALSVPLWGYPVEYQETLEILDRHGIPLIEDAAQAHGTIISGKYAGTHGKVGCFSTHDRKLLSTGEGGFVLTNDENAAQIIRRFSQLGYMDGQHYGQNFKLNTLSAALGIYRLQFLQDQIKIRRNNVNEFFRSFKTDLLEELWYTHTSCPNYYNLVLRLKLSKAELGVEFSRLLAERGIYSDITKYGYRPLYQRPLFNKWATKCVNAELFIPLLIQLPIHPGLTQDEISYMANSIMDCNRIISEGDVTTSTP